MSTSTLSSYSNRTKPMSGWALAFLAIVAVGLACLYRLPDLGLKPMHTDEAILGMKFIDMCKQGRFDYDPHDFHGPVLHYVTWIYGTVMGWKDSMAITEADLRQVVAMVGILLVLSTLLATDALGRLATGLAMLMMAVSPMMVFFSRYYIMEVPYVLWLALFIFGCWRFSVYESWLWLALAAGSVGLMHATKETFIINMGAMLCGWVAAKMLTDGFEHRNRGMHLSIGRSRHFIEWPWLWGALVALVVSVLLFSGGFRFWDDVKESFTTYASYAHRSTGVGHEKPWYYYLTVLLYTQEFFVWTEAMIVVLAGFGMLHAFTGRFQREEPRKAFLVFLSVYALVALAFYSVIPYKTPWTILSVQHVLTLLAGVGAQFLFGLSSSRIWKSICTIAMVAGLYHLCAQSMFTIRDRGRANLRGPYVYSHTTPSAMQLVEKLRDLAKFEGDKFAAQVITVDSGWPLPWYLRKQSHVGYQTTVPEKLDADVIVVDQAFAADVRARLKDKQFVSDVFGMRGPGTNVVLLVEKKLWDAWSASKARTP
jgi:uncharacterized protein (TIGR03663 family)